MDLVISVVFVALMLAALVHDVRTRRLPNRLTVAGLALGLLLRLPLGWGMMGEGLLGAGLGLLIGLPLFMIGGIGGGDAKLLAAVGAFTGPPLLLTALLASAVLGGFMGLYVLLARRTALPVLGNIRGLLVYMATLGKAGERVTLDSPGALRIPYGAAIALGSLAAWFLPLSELIWR